MNDLDISLIITGLSVLIAGTTAILSWYTFTRSLRREDEAEGRRRSTLDQRLTRLTSALNESARTIREIEEGLAERQKLAIQLKKDVETYEHLKRVRGPEIEAVARVLSGELQKEGRRNLWRDVTLFAAGVIVTVVTSLYFG